MTDHPEDGTLLARLDGELAPREREAVRRHLGGCERCRRRLEALKGAARTFSRAVSLVDRPPPRAEPPAAGRGAPAGRARRGPRRSRWLRSAWLKAAVLLLTVVGVAAAVPGSPVRGWIERSLRGLGLAGPDQAAPVAREDSGGRRPAAASGVSVPLRDGHVLIRLGDAPAGTEVRVRLVGGTEASVRATGGRYRTAPGRLELQAPSAGPVAVDVPRSATARLEVDGRPVLVKESDGLRVLTPSADTAGSEIRFSVGS